MGKPTGFLEYERQTSEETEPKARIKNFKEFHSLCPGKTENSGGQVYGLRSAVLPVRQNDRRYGFRLSAQQPDSGVE